VIHQATPTRHSPMYSSHVGERYRPRPCGAPPRNQPTYSPLPPPAAATATAAMAYAARAAASASAAPGTLVLSPSVSGAAVDPPSLPEVVAAAAAAASAAAAAAAADGAHTRTINGGGPLGGAPNATGLSRSPAVAAAAVVAEAAAVAVVAVAAVAAAAVAAAVATVAAAAAAAAALLPRTLLSGAYTRPILSST